MTAHDLSTLHHALPADQIITNRVQLRTYAADAGLNRGTPDGVAFPRTTDEVAKIVRSAAAHVGAGTLARWLSDDTGQWHDEAVAIERAGLASSELNHSSGVAAQSRCKRAMVPAASQRIPS